MLRRFLAFALISGLGWLLDMMVFSGSLHIGLRPFGANLLGGLAGASFSFIVSGRQVFVAGRRQIRDRILFYLGYTVLVIVAMSGLIEVTTSWILEHVDWSMQHAAIFAKVILTPLILLSNFLVAGWLLAPFR